jgi:hypothetical protein
VRDQRGRLVAAMMEFCDGRSTNSSQETLGSCEGLGKTFAKGSEEERSQSGSGNNLDSEQLQLGENVEGKRLFHDLRLIDRKAVHTNDEDRTPLLDSQHGTRRRRAGHRIITDIANRGFGDPRPGIRHRHLGSGERSLVLKGDGHFLGVARRRPFA